MRWANYLLMNSHRTYFINLINALGTRDSQMASLLNPILKKNESNKQKDGYGNGIWEERRAFADIWVFGSTKFLVDYSLIWSNPLCTLRTKIKRIKRSEEGTNSRKKGVEDARRRGKLVLQLRWRCDGPPLRLLRLQILGRWAEGIWDVVKLFWVVRRGCGRLLMVSKVPYFEGFELSWPLEYSWKIFLSRMQKWLIGTNMGHPPISCWLLAPNWVWSSNQLLIGSTQMGVFH